MITYKLEKKIQLYKSQYDQLMLGIFHSHAMDRASMDLDAMLFRMQYMVKHNKDLEMLPQLREAFNQKSVELQRMFGRFMWELVTRIIGIPAEYSADSIVDIMAQDVKIDPVYVSFTMVVLCNSEGLLAHIDASVTDGRPYNMFPNEYFRFFTDSYNDGIAKAYPELFENKHVDGIDSADGDIFCHNFTFQVTEDCSLNCFDGDTMIMMADWTEKPIRDIKVGDMILGIPEHQTNNDHEFYDAATYVPSRVTRVYQREADCIRVNWKSGVGPDDPIYMTPDHPVLMSAEYYVSFIDWYHDKCGSDDPIFVGPNKICSNFNQWELDVDETPVRREVYNLETECHTFIAWNMVVHNCNYCYQCNKSPMRMSFDTAKIFIDNLLHDKYGYINHRNSPAIIIEFIGGEPLLETKLIRRIYEYFLDQCYQMNHPWFHLHRLSICSNGMQYFNVEVQDFFKEYHHNISFNISIDGNKELHDACRIQPNGEGSYDIDMMALNHYTTHYSPERNSKMTLAPSNIRYLFDSVVDFIDKGMRIININCVFEEGWTKETALEEYNQLKRLADYIIEHDLHHLYIAIFNERQEDVQDRTHDSTFCGGTGSMLSMRPNGQFYPCIRYMPSSVGDNVDDLCIGDVRTGMVGRKEGSEILKMMDRITRRSQSNDICYECPIGNDCAWCSALGHAVFGTPDKRVTFSCIQMIAEALANVYYWNLLNIRHPEFDLDVRKNNVPDEWARIIIDEDELDFLKNIEAYSMIVTFERRKKLRTDP